MARPWGQTSLVELTWYGSALGQAVRDAERAAIAETLDAAVDHAKAHHSWTSRTGAALASIRRADIVPSPGAVSSYFGFMPIALTNPHRARSQKTGRLRKASKWDMHGLFLEIGWSERGSGPSASYVERLRRIQRGARGGYHPGDWTVHGAAEHEFPHLWERIRAHLPADMRS